MVKKTIMFLIGAFFLIIFSQFTMAVADWGDFGRDARITQTQSSSYSSQFGNAGIIISSMANGLSTNNSNLAYQPLIPEIAVTGNYLVLSNGNYLQVYDKNLNLLTEKFTGKSEGQLSAVNYIGDFSNIKNILGFWRFNNTMLSFRAYNYTGNLSLIFESNLSTSLPATTNGVKCFTALGYGECYAFIDEEINSTLYQHSFLKITYNSFNQTADFTKYIMTNTTSKILEPPSWSDWDLDGTLEFLGFSPDRILVVNYNGNLELNYTGFNSIYGNPQIEGAKFIRTDAGNQKIIAVNQENFIWAGLGFNRIRYRVIKTDGTILWENLIISSNSGDVWRNNGLAILDYNGDAYEDVWAMETRTGTNQHANFTIYKGSDGTFLYQNVIPNTTYNNVQAPYGSYSMTLAKMNPDSTFDFVGARNGYAYFWDTANAVMNFSDNIGSVSCIPADLDYDGLIDDICTSPSGTTKYSVNYTNQNAYITSVSFSPSTAIAVNSTLTITIYATDLESNYIYYSVRCNDTASYTTDTGSNVKYCTYDTIGTYNVTIRVRDEFHSVYNTYTQPIDVTLTTYAQATGGLAIPTKIVDTQNTEQGLLPEIYYGLIAFFSNVTAPFIVIVFVIFITLIIFTIGAIIKKLAMKVGS